MLNKRPSAENYQTALEAYFRDLTIEEEVEEVPAEDEQFQEAQEEAAEV